MQTILGLCLLGLNSSCLRPAEVAVPCLVILSSKPSYLPCLLYTWNISHTLFQGFTWMNAGHKSYGNSFPFSLVFCFTYRINPFVLMVNTFLQLDITHMSTHLGFVNYLAWGPAQVCCAEAPKCIASCPCCPPPLPRFQAMWKSAWDFSVTHKAGCQPCYRVSFSSWVNCNENLSLSWNVHCSAES